MTWCITYGAARGNKCFSPFKSCILIQKRTGHASVGIFQVQLSFGASGVESQDNSLCVLSFPDPLILNWVPEIAAYETADAQKVPGWIGVGMIGLERMAVVSLAADDNELGRT